MGATDRELVAILQALAGAHDLTVHDGPVRAAGVLDPPFSVGEFDERVPRGGSLVVDHDVVPGVAPQAIHRAKWKPIADAERAAHGALDDKVREASRAGRDGVLGGERALQRAEDADQEEIEKDEKQDPDAPEEDSERDLHQSVARN